MSSFKKKTIVNEKTKLKEGEVKKFSYKIFEEGVERGEDKDLQAILIVGYRKGKKDGEYIISPYAVGHGEGLFKILEDSGEWETECAKQLGMLEALTMAKMMGMVGKLGSIMGNEKKPKKSKKSSKSKK